MLHLLLRLVLGNDDAGAVPHEREECLVPYDVPVRYSLHDYGLDS